VSSSQRTKYSCRGKNSERREYCWGKFTGQAEFF